MEANHTEQNYFCEITFRSGPPLCRLSTNSNLVRKLELGKILYEWTNLAAKSVSKSVPCCFLYFMGVAYFEAQFLFISFRVIFKIYSMLNYLVIPILHRQMSLSALPVRWLVW